MAPVGVIPSDIHLLGVEGVPVEEALFILGTDLNGRDLWSRLMFATQMSLTIGLAAAEPERLLRLCDRVLGRRTPAPVAYA